MSASSLGMAAISAALVLLAPLAMSDDDFGLHDARAEAVRAELDENWTLYRQYMWNTITADEISSTPEFAEAAIAHKQSDRRTGIRLQSERVDSVVFHEEQDRRLAILEVTRLFDHPLSPAKPIATHNRVYAIREAGQSQWRFNVSSCFSKEDLAAQFPSAAQDIK